MTHSHTHLVKTWSKPTHTQSDTAQPQSRRCRRRACSAFSLVEIMAITVIIVVIMSAAAAVSFKMFDTAAEKHTRITLAVLKGIADEYEAQTGTVIDHTAAPSTTMEWFVQNAQQLPLTEKMLASIGQNMLEDIDNDGDVDTVLDGWGTPIRYMSSTVGMAAYVDYQYPVFVSAGEDRLFGSVDPAATAQDKADSEDNLYSFDPERFSRDLD